MSEKSSPNEEKSLKENATIDLSAPGGSDQLASLIKRDIDDYCIAEYDGGFRWHLGASLIGQECQRAVWYSFRWAAHSRLAQDTTPNGRASHARMQRLFNRGHREEARFVEFLRGTGWQVFEFDTSQPPNQAGEYPQFRISGIDGHFGGSLDGIGVPPERYGLPAGTACLLEFKTNATGSSFKSLGEKGVMLAKQQHYAQMSTYGSDANYKLEYALYLNICKNDDNLHVEIVKLDWELGEQMRLRAERIIKSQTPPPRLSDNPTFYKCKYCDYFAQCHGSAPLEKNCRSCKFAKPAESGEWECGKANQIIPRDFVRQGCGEWRTVNNE